MQKLFMGLYHEQAKMKSSYTFNSEKLGQDITLEVVKLGPRPMPRIVIQWNDLPVPPVSDVGQADPTHLGNWGEIYGHTSVIASLFNTKIAEQGEYFPVNKLVIGRTEGSDIIQSTYLSQDSTERVVDMLVRGGYMSNEQAAACKALASASSHEDQRGPGSSRGGASRF